MGQWLCLCRLHACLLYSKVCDCDVVPTGAQQQGGVKMCKIYYKTHCMHRAMQGTTNDASAGE